MNVKNVSCINIIILSILFERREGLAFSVFWHKTFALTVLLGLGMFDIIILIAALMGSALPDCDTPYSHASRWLPLYKLSKHQYHCHRKVSHSWYAAIFFGAIGYLILPKIGIGLFIGYVLHLYIDKSTKVSLPYEFWPYSYNPNHWYFKDKNSRYEEIEEAAE